MNEATTARPDCPHWKTEAECEVVSGRPLCRCGKDCGFYPPTAAKRAAKIRERRAKELAPKCPVCGAPADIYVRNRIGIVVGCGECLVAVDA